MQIVYLVGLFVLGTSIASFFNQFIFRDEHNWNWRGRSKCEKCGTPIPNKYLIPIVGYIWTKGQCHHCGYKIPIIYPISEFFIGLVLALLYLNKEPFIYFVFFVALSYFALFDLQYKKIPKLWTDIFILSSVLLGLIFNWQNISYLLLISLIIIVGFLIIAKLFGLGDLLILLSGFMLLSKNIFFDWIVWSILLGGLYGIFVLIKSKDKKKKHFIPFIPFLWCGFLLALFFSPLSYFYGILYL